MKIMPISGYDKQISYTHNQNNEKKLSPAKAKTIAIATAGVAGSLAVGALIYTLSRGRKAPKPGITNKLPISIPQMGIFEREIQLFPKDISYRKALLNGINSNPENYAILRPIIGPEEYSTIVKDFSHDEKFYSPGKTIITEQKDGFDLSGKTNYTYRANMHMHTVNSDGKMTVKELLDQGAEYANEVFKNLISNNPKTTAKHAPFTIAITDHDTLEGCKEAVKIISQDPWKYRNLRVILGCEMTVENKIIPQQLKSPVPIHMLLHGINPFDTRLNAFLDSKKAARFDLINKIIQKAKDKMEPKFPQTANKLSFEDATILYPTFKHRILHVDYSTKDYLQFRTIFSECFENNPEIQKQLAGKENINYNAPKEKFFGTIKDNFGDKYWKKYVLALQKYTAELLGITEEEAAKKITVSPELEKLVEELGELTKEAQAKLDLAPAFVDMEEAINLIKHQDAGYMSIAHPGLTGIGDCLQNPEESFNGMYDLFRTFKQIGGDRAISAEVHYHYFGDFAQNPGSKEWLNNIKNYINRNYLYNGGGLDTHGKSIFYSVKS